MIRLEHSVTYDRIERDATRFVKAHDGLRKTTTDLEARARDTKAAFARLQAAMADALARMR